MTAKPRVKGGEHGLLLRAQSNQVFIISQPYPSGEPIDPSVTQQGLVAWSSVWILVKCNNAFILV